MASSLNFTFPRADRSLSEMLSGTPRAFREQAKKGFKVLAGISQQHYAEILRGVVITLENRQPPFDDLEKRLSLSKEQLSALMAAAMITVPLLGDSGTPEEFITAAVKVEMLPAELASQIRPFIDVVVAERQQLGRSMRRASMPSQVLPFLAEVDIVVDLRMAFDGPKVSEAVPVAIIHIDTDATGGEIWFQASKSQMERLKNDIDTAIKRMETADAWTGRGKEPAL